MSINFEKAKKITNEKLVSFQKAQIFKHIKDAKVTIGDSHTEAYANANAAGITLHNLNKIHLEIAKDNAEASKVFHETHLKSLLNGDSTSIVKGCVHSDNPYLQFTLADNAEVTTQDICGAQAEATWID